MVWVCMQEALSNLGDVKIQLSKIFQFKEIDGVPATVAGINQKLSAAALAVNYVDDVKSQAKGWLRNQQV